MLQLYGEVQAYMKSRGPCTRPGGGGPAEDLSGDGGMARRGRQRDSQHAALLLELVVRQLSVYFPCCEATPAESMTGNRAQSSPWAKEASFVGCRTRPPEKSLRWQPR